MNKNLILEYNKNIQDKRKTQQWLRLNIYTAESKEKGI